MASVFGFQVQDPILNNLLCKKNLPGSSDYDPSISYLMKIRGDGLYACDILLYADDGRIVGSNRELYWQAMRQAASLFNSLGIQDAARKRRFPSQSPGLWSGNLINTVGEPTLGVSQDQ